MAAYASPWPEGDHASPSSQAYGEATFFRHDSSVGATLPVLASHTSTTERPSDSITLSSLAVISASRLPSRAAASSRTYLPSSISFSARQLSRSSFHTWLTLRTPWPYSSLANSLRR